MKTKKLPSQKESSTDILSERDRGISKARSPLARLFRRVLFDLNITHAQWRTMMSNYFENPRNFPANSSSDINSMRGNLNKELKKPVMSVRVLTKGIRMLAPVSARLELQLTWRNGKTTVSSVPLLDEQETNEPSNLIDENLQDQMLSRVRQTETPKAKVTSIQELIRRVRESQQQAENQSPEPGDDSKDSSG